MFVNLYEDKLQQLYKRQIQFFRICGAYHLPTDTANQKLGYDLCFKAILLATGVFNLCVGIEFFLQPSILDKIVKVLFGFVALFAGFVKLVYIKVNTRHYRAAVTLLARDIFIPINTEEDAILNRNIRMSVKCRNIYCLVVSSALLSFNIVPSLTHSHELAVAVYTPFEINFLFLVIYSFVVISYLCYVNLAFDLWCTSFLTFAKAQLEILALRLEGLGSVDHNSLTINRELKKCIHHHAEVYNYVKVIEEAISAPVSIQIFCSISVLCCNFFAISLTSITDDTSAFVIFFTYQMAMLSEIFLLCYFSNEVTLVSLKLSHALYSSDWTPWDRPNRKLMLVTMLRFEEPIVVRSINHCYPFNLAAFTSIVNTSYSYFALLKQINN